MVDAGGQVRPAWRPLIAALDALGREETGGAASRAPTSTCATPASSTASTTAPTGKERAWPLAHVPLLIDEAEWQQHHRRPGAARRTARADRRRHLRREPRWCADGLLPPELIARNAEFLRPLVGVKPASGHFLHFCAFELGRGPDGGWWVLGDRTQAPSGAGFALENRVATTRALSDIYARMHVHRLAGFFRDFRDALNGQAARRRRPRRHPDARASTTRPISSTPTSPATSASCCSRARTSTVENGQVMVRTVAGLKPVERAVAPHRRRLRRPAGTAPRQPHRHARAWPRRCAQGSISMVNALGSGILETRALSAFLPRLAGSCSASTLALPTIATWWCGQPAERAARHRQLRRA